MTLDDTQHDLSGNSSRSTRHPETGRGGPPARATGGSKLEPTDSDPTDSELTDYDPTAHEPPGSPVDRLTDRLDSEPGQPVTVSTDSLRVRLLGVPRVGVEEVVYAYQQTPRVDGDSRPSALFDIENTSSRPIRWNPKRTSFIGTDGYTYREAHLSVDPARLGAGCHTRLVEIEPGCRARVMTLVERLPETVEVARVVHSVASSRHPDQRLTFKLQ